MNLLLENKKLIGSVNVPSSKSLAHRYLICGALAKEPGSIITNVSVSDDILATINVLEALGAEIEVRGNTCTIIKCISNTRSTVLDCKESGSVLRFFLPIALMLVDEVKFIGKGRLLERPLTPYFDIMDKQGIAYVLTQDSLIIKGKLSGNKYELPGDISSQFITGLLFAAVLSDQDTIIEITTTLQSVGYVEMTLDAFECFGVHVIREENRFIITGDQCFEKTCISVEGDYSQAAFFLVAGALGNEINVLGINEDSLQGDKEIVQILKNAGATIVQDNDVIKAVQNELKPFVVDASDIPDLVPILAVLACGIKGDSKIINASRTRLKESDRLYTIAKELRALGGDVLELEDGLIIKGTGSLKGGTVIGHNDHRIAMALAIASTIAKNNVVINGAECVSKTYPHFFEHIVSLGGKYEHMGQ